MDIYIAISYFLSLLEKSLQIGPDKKQSKNLATALYKQKINNNFDPETKTKKIKTKK